MADSVNICAGENDLNLISLIKELSLLFTKDLVNNDRRQDKQVQLKVAKSLQKRAFDILRTAEDETEDAEWYPEIRIADFAYELINNEDERRGRKLLENVALLQPEGFTNLDEIWSFLLNHANFDVTKKGTSNDRFQHPFSFSGNDYFLQDVNPYGLLPKCSDSAECNEPVLAVGKEDLFLDLFIEEPQRRIFDDEASVPSLFQFVNSNESFSNSSRIKLTPATSSRNQNEEEVQPCGIASASALQAKEDTLLLEIDEFHQNTSFTNGDLESLFDEDADLLQRRKSSRSILDNEFQHLVIGLYEESCSVRQIVEEPFERHLLHEITVDDFITKGKFLLCGINSDLFHFDEAERVFYMKAGAYVCGITPDSLFEISKSLLEAGTFFKRVSRLVSDGLQYASGILQPTFWKSVDNHLVKYREAVTSIPGEGTLMGFKLATADLEREMVALNKLCSPKGGHLPRGGQLLTHLHELCCAEQQLHVQDVLFSTLLDCCRVYISKLIEKWIFQGLQDVTSEFFIRIDGDLAERQDRYYAYQSVNVDEQLVPCFLAGLVRSIYSAGKAVWLLKLFHPQNAFIYYMESLKYPRLKICTTEDELIDLKHTLERYRAAVEKSCGDRVTFLGLENKEKQMEEERINSIKITRQKVMQILEEKRVAKLKLHEEKMIEKEKMLKEQLEAMEESRQREKEEKREERRIHSEKLAKESHKEETLRYYREMSEVAEQMKREAEWQSKRLELHDKRIAFLKDDVINKNTGLDEEGNVVVVNAELLDAGDEVPNREESHFSDQNSNTLIMQDVAVAEDAHQADLIDQTNNNADRGDRTSSRYSEAQLNKEKILGSGHFEGSNEEDTITLKAELTDAEKNKLKMMRTEYDFNVPSPKFPMVPKLTEAMRNKLKVLRSEYYLEDKEEVYERVVLTEAMKNKLKIMGSDYATPLEPAIRKSGPLTEAQRNKLKVLGTEFDIPVEDFLPKPRRKASEEIEIEHSVEVEAPVVEMSEEPAVQPAPPPIAHIFRLEPLEPTNSFFTSVINDSTDHVTYDSVGRDVAHFSRLLQRSLGAVLRTQEDLANSAVLTHFIMKEDVMTHISCLRRYFLHYDGEFSRNLTHGLFHALTQATEPSQFFDKSVLSGILNEALHGLHNSQNLSFQIIRMPTKLKLESHSVLSPFQLSYLVKWPLNIVITDQAFDRYRKVFHLLVNLKRVHWTLNETFLLLKTQTKDNVLDGKRLMNSPEYTKLATYRHAMTLFIMTLEEHCTNGLQEAWEIFTKNLHSVADLEQLYQTHVAFIKDVCRRCFLAKATNDLLSYIHEMIELGLQFHYILKSSRWRLISDAHYSHPKYDQLRKIFRTFCKTTKIFYSTLEKKTQHADLKIHIPMLELIDMKIKI